MNTNPGFNINKKTFNPWGHSELFVAERERKRKQINKITKGLQLKRTLYGYDVLRNNRLIGAIYDCGCYYTATVGGYQKGGNCQTLREATIQVAKGATW